MKTNTLKLCTLFAIAIATPAFAGITIDSTLRVVEYENTPHDGWFGSVIDGAFSEHKLDSDGAQIPQTSGEADQDSNISTLNYGGDFASFYIGGTSSPTGAFASSHLQVDFTIDSQYNFTAGGFLRTVLDGGEAEAVVYLIRKSDSLFMFLYSGDSNGVDAANSGALQPDSYRYYVYTTSTGTDNGNSYCGAQIGGAFLTLEETAVPEPASLSILAIGGAGLMLRRKRTA